MMDQRKQLMREINSHNSLLWQEQKKLNINRYQLQNNDQWSFIFLLLPAGIIGWSLARTRSMPQLFNQVAELLLFFSQLKRL